MEQLLDNVEIIQEKIKECGEFVKKYEWLSESFMVDFFTENFWDTKLPASWTSALSTAKPSDLEELLDYEKVTELTSLEWPREILEIREKVRNLSIPRTPISKGLFHRILDNGGSEVPNDNWQTFSQEVSRSAGHHKNAENVFRKHVKPKKQHEIARLSEVITAVANKQNIRYLIDVGSGLGHLSRFLSFGHGFKVICVDAQDNLSQTASKFDEDLRKAFKQEEREGPRHETYLISSETSSEDFENAIFTSEAPENFGLIGLHTCGDLGPTILKLFLKCPKAKFLISVGCCYMKLDKNFPLNAIFEEIDLKDPGYCTKELACHAIEAFRERLLDENELQKLKVHCNRAVLEKLIVSRWPDKVHIPLKSVAHSHDLPFEMYVKKATENLSIQFDDRDLQSDDVKKELEKWSLVLGFYVLRLLIAPVIEHLLLLDRLLFLVKSGHQSSLLPVFDPKLSPRNHVLFSLKK